jgi:uncharacterized protein YbjT (DUF2867 family)
MRIAVIGGTGTVGRPTVRALREAGHDVVVGARSAGVDVLTGEGLDDALAGVGAVIDVTNAWAATPEEAREVFGVATERLLEAGRRAGVVHHVLLSIAGIDRVEGNAHYAGKRRQEELVEAAPEGTIVRATQFHEFARAIVDSMVVEVDTDEGDEHDVRVPDALIQPIAADEVAAYLAEVAIEPPRNHVINIGGPEKFPFSRLAREVLALHHDDQRVVVDPHAKYFGTTLKKESLVTGAGAMIASIPF